MPRICRNTHAFMIIIVMDKWLKRNIELKIVYLYILQEE